MRRSLATIVVLMSLAIGISGTAYGACANASGIFSLNVTIANSDLEECGVFGTNTAETFLDKFKQSGLSSIAGITYSGTEITSISAVFNSLPIQLAFPNQGATGSGALLTFNIAALGISQTFNGATRDASQSLLVDYLKKSGVIGQIMKYQAQNSPFSPIAGPGGTIPTMVSGSFNENFNDTATNIAGPADAAAAAKLNGYTPNLISASTVYSSLNVKDEQVNFFALPLSYTIRNDIDPRRQLVISVPLAVTDTGGAKSYSGGLGVSYRFPINDAWTITPGVKAAVSGSKDLATLAGVYSAFLTSTYIWSMDNYDVAMGNMVGYVKTMKLSVGDYSADPGINSTVFRNGLLFSQPVSLSGKKLSLEFSIIDTRYTGGSFYVDNTQEFGIALGTNKHAYSARSFFRVGLSYLHGKDTNGVTGNLGFWF